MSSDNISSLFYEISEKTPHKLAIIYNGKSITFGQLQQEVSDTMAYFEHKGIKKGDRILVFVGMSIDLYRIVLATFALGAVAVLVDEWVSIKRLEMCCEIAQCKAFIAPFTYRIMALAIPELRKIPVFLSHKKQIKQSEISRPKSILMSNEALITFTTGSTGIPKAISRSHGFLAVQFQALKPLVKGDVSMTMLPVVMLLNLGLGLTSFIPKFKNKNPKKFDSQKVLQQINLYAVNSIVASPYYLVQLAKQAQINLNIKSIVSGGAPMFAPDADLIAQVFPQADFNIVYGSTEAEPMAHTKAQKLIINQEFGLLVGEIHPLLELKIIAKNKQHRLSREALEQLTLPAGEVGEIIVSGPTVNENYINNPAAVEANKIITPHKTWHRTGDSGYLNSHNQLFLSGRLEQIIYHKGQIYYPFVIENQLKLVAKIKSGTMLLMNNQLTLFLCVEDGFDPKVLGFLTYDKLIYLKEIPLDPRHHGKVDYQLLKCQMDGSEVL